MPYTQENCGDTKLGLAAEMLRGRGTVRVKAWGTSMLPSLWPGDLLTIQSVSNEKVVPGEIVLVMRDNRFCIHRLIKKEQIQDCVFLITKGDAVPQNDPRVAASELLGRVTDIRRGNRSFVPNCEVSLMQASMTWMLRHCDHFRSAALRVHAVRIRASSTRTGKFLCGIVPAFRVIRSISVSRTTYP
jgi:signal peptidase I